MVTEVHPITEHIGIAVSSFVAGGGLVRVLVYISKALPQLPKDAGFFQQFAYNLVKGTSGVDPSATTLSPTAMSALPASVSATVTRAAEAEKS